MDATQPWAHHAKAAKRDGGALVRLHSCPSFADALKQATARGDSTPSGADKPFAHGQGLSRRASSRAFFDGRGLGRKKSADQLEYDTHFRRYLEGLLDDLVHWKLRQKQYPPLRS